MCRATAHGAASQPARSAVSDATRADSYRAKGKRVRTSQSCRRTSPTRRGPSRAAHGRGLRPGMHRPFRWAEKPPRAAARRSASLRHVEPRPPPQSPADEARDRKGRALGHDWKQRQKTRTRQSAAIREARPCQRWHGQRWCPPQPATSYKADHLGEGYGEDDSRRFVHENRAEHAAPVHLRRPVAYHHAVQ